jgi:putative peptide zinc metalloprotease protein
MDGYASVQELWRHAVNRLGQHAPTQDEMLQLLAKLNAANLLQTNATPDSSELIDRSNRAKMGTWIKNFLNPLALRLRVWHPDAFFEKSLPFVKWFICWQGFLVWLLVVLSAIILAAQHSAELAADISKRSLAAENLPLLVVSYVFLKALHELGHGYATKAFGGVVHEVGVMFLVFIPVPYVDCSGALEFRSKWRRAFVGAAGMMVEVFVAALALFVWITVEDGLVRYLAFNVMLISGIATVVFNANPLLRFDGYYILSDILELPNWAQRSAQYWLYLFECYVFGARPAEEFSGSASERTWLLLYAPASAIYRLIVLVTIALFVASEYLVVGVVIGALGLIYGLLIPCVKLLWQLFAGPRFKAHRLRAVATTVGFIAAALVFLFLVPIPASTIAEGVVRLPESATVRAGTGGFVERVAVEPGTRVLPGEELVQLEEPQLAADLASLEARVAELKAAKAATYFVHHVKAGLTAAELEHAQTALTAANKRAERLTIRSEVEGSFAMLHPEDSLGRYLHEGQAIGYILPLKARFVRATIRQDDIDLIRRRLRNVWVRLAGDANVVLSARILREVTANHDQELAEHGSQSDRPKVPAGDPAPHMTYPINREFEVEVELLPEGVDAVAFGSRAYLRFELDWEPAGHQILRRTYQLLLSHLLF